MSIANWIEINRGIRWQSVVGWLVFVILGLTTLAFVQLRFQLDELKSNSADLHRLASQRAGQHDVHLTALSSIAAGSAGLRPDLFLEVSATISRFYPRIVEVQLVPLDPSLEGIGSVPLAPDAAAAIRLAALRSTGMPTLLPHPTRARQYFLVKRSPNSDAAVYALALSVDAAQLVDSDVTYWSRENVGIRLTLPRGEPLISSFAMNAAQFSKPLESASQPLLLETAIRIRIADLLPLWQIIGVVLLVSFTYFTALTGLRQRARIRAAEREAELGRVEAQLAHAARVNAMGEMASGMAHELTQPLTAILAQLQAGQHLLARSDTDALAPALRDAVGQAKRAAAILERLRNWSRPQRAPLAAIDLRDALRNVRALFAPEAKRRGVALNFDISGRAINVLADQVEMEQVIYNVIRNALEASEKRPGASVSLHAEITAGAVVVEIADNGPGVDENILPVLFTPFMTTRDEGTGLGLALSQRLVERAGGEISYVAGSPGAIFRIVLPMANHAAEAAQ